jgi:two-component system, chemotaxis family, protein-glutamate methylesterase/glutaminase
VSQVPDPAGGRRADRVIAIGASAGGVDALQRIVAALPAELPAAICVVLHIPATGKSLLAPILERAGALPAQVAEHGMTLTAGRIYVAPADLHLLVRGDRLELDPGPKENGVRPAVDVLFRSVAASWGSQAVAVVLSGALDDGASGVVNVTETGGTVVVQEPGDALVPSMPESALAAAGDALVAPAAELAPLLVRLVSQAAAEEVVMTRDLDPFDLDLTRGRPEGPPSGFTCPECSGGLWELREGELIRYQCRVGHTYSEEAFVDHQASAVEAALWAALEVLEERAELLQGMADRMAGRTARSARRFQTAARDAHARAELIRRALTLRRAPGDAVDDLREASTG